MKFTFIVFIIAAFQFGCAKNDFKERVSISSISPSSGTANTRVIIKGSNFSTNPEDNLVKFNNDSAVVVLASIDSLVVLSPPGGTSGPVSVSINGNMVTGPVFTYINDSIDVYAVAPAFGVILWKNGVENFLAPTQNNFGGAYGLAVSGEDVYVAGYSYFTAAYWKNGQKITLSEPDSTAEARAIVLSVNNDIYVGGSDGPAPVYWKNGVKNRLPFDQTGFGRVNALAINGNDVYAAGYEAGGSNSHKLVYWKNGIKTILGTRAIVDGGATSIAISGPDVYISGTDSGDAVYWKNEVRVVLSKFTPQGPTTANAIALSGQSIYAVGSYLSDAVYWKDGEKFILPKDSYAATATSITFYQSDIYIGGADGSTPVYWKNGVKHVLCCSQSGSVNAIVVKKH
jgi:hypothetical protein